jgi:hypothetical protein
MIMLGLSWREVLQLEVPHCFFVFLRIFPNTEALFGLSGGGLLPNMIWMGMGCFVKLLIEDTYRSQSRFSVKKVGREHYADNRGKCYRV